VGIGKAGLKETFWNSYKTNSFSPWWTYPTETSAMCAEGCQPSNDTRQRGGPSRQPLLANDNMWTGGPIYKRS